MSENAVSDLKKSVGFIELQRLLAPRCEAGATGVLLEAYAFLTQKWTLLVLGALIHGTRRNAELQRQVVGISPKMLTQTLRKLEAYNLVTRKVYPEVPPRVEYTLTAFGESTAEPIMAVLAWYTQWEDVILAGIQATLPE